MDILEFRSTLCAKLAKSFESDGLYNPVVTKPSQFMSIRSIVDRYARGEIVSRPESLLETPVYDDVVKHVDNISSNLDYQQRIDDLKSNLNKRINETETAQNRAQSANADTNVDSISESDSEGSKAAGN